MKKLAFGSCLAVCLCGGLAAPCAAAPVTFDFTGTVTEARVAASDTSGIVIEAGMTFSGSYTFESTTPDRSSSSRTGFYEMNGAPSQLTVNLGAFTTTITNLLEIDVWQSRNGPADEYAVISCSDDMCLEGVQMYFSSRDDTLFDSDALPLMPPSFSAFESAIFYFNRFIVGDEWTSFSGNIDSLVCSAGCDPVVGAPVPEPGTLLLVGSPSPRRASAVAAPRPRRGLRGIAPQSPQRGCCHGTIPL